MHIHTHTKYNSNIKGQSQTGKGILNIFLKSIVFIKSTLKQLRKNTKPQQKNMQKHKAKTVPQKIQKPL